MRTWMGEHMYVVRAFLSTFSLRAVVSLREEEEEKEEVKPRVIYGL